MSKAKKKVPIELVQSPPADPDDKPMCYGEKSEYCKRELCGKWFDNCGQDLPFTDVT